MQERHCQARHLGFVRAVGRSRPGTYRGGFCALAISPHVCSRWVLGSRPGMASPCDIGLGGRCSRPRGAGPLRRCGASWRSPASRFALAARCVRCLPMGRHHCALRSRPRPPAQRLPMGRRYPAGRSRADVEPGPARSLWRLRLGPGSRWRSRFPTPEAPTLWRRACGMQDVGMWPHSDLGPGIAGARLRATAPLRDVGPSGVVSSQGPDPARKPGGRAFARVRVSAPSPCRAGPAAMPRGRPRPRARRLCRTC